MNQNILEAKKAVVSEVKETIENSKSLIIAEYRGLNVSEVMVLRRELLKLDAKMSVYKNSMVERAVEQLGHSDLNDLLVGPNAYITCADPINGPKVVAKFAKKHDKFVIKGGLIEGKVVSKAEIIELSKLPGREGLLSMLLSVLQAPVRSFACAVKAVADNK